MAYIPSTPPPFDPQSPQHGALVQVVRQYREAGWFEHETGSDEKVAEGARERWWAEWEDEVDTSGPDDGIFICMADPQRAAGSTRSGTLAQRTRHIPRSWRDWPLSAGGPSS